MQQNHSCPHNSKLESSLCQNWLLAIYQIHFADTSKGALDADYDTPLKDADKNECTMIAQYSKQLIHPAIG